MYICICVYICVYVYIYIYIYVCTYHRRGMQGLTCRWCWTSWMSLRARPPKRSVSILSPVLIASKYYLRAEGVRARSDENLTSDYWHLTCDYSDPRWACLQNFQSKCWRDVIRRVDCLKIDNLFQTVCLDAQVAVVSSYTFLRWSIQDQSSRRTLVAGQ